MKTQFFQMTFKDVEIKAGKVRIKGLASTPQVDRYNDIVKPEAFMNAMTSYMQNPIVLLQHDSKKPIGCVTEYKIVPEGLEVTAEISNDIDNCMKLIVDKVLRGFSIGFQIKKWEFTMRDIEDGIAEELRVITDLDLIEISVVSTPANPGSLFTLSKSIREFFIKEGGVVDAGVKEELFDITPEKEVTPEAPAPIVSETVPAEITGETPAPVVVETTPAAPVKEEPKVEIPSETQVLQGQIEAINAKIDELAKVNAELLKANEALTQSNKEKDLLITELTEKTVSLQGKLEKTGVRKAVIITGTKSISKVLTYSNLIHK